MPRNVRLSFLYDARGVYRPFRTMREITFFFACVCVCFCMFLLFFSRSHISDLSSRTRRHQIEERPQENRETDQKQDEKTEEGGCADRGAQGGSLKAGMISLEETDRQGDRERARARVCVCLRLYIHCYGDHSPYKFLKIAPLPSRYVTNV